MARQVNHLPGHFMFCADLQSRPRGLSWTLADPILELPGRKSRLRARRRRVKTWRRCDAGCVLEEVRPATCSITPAPPSGKVSGFCVTARAAATTARKSWLGRFGEGGAAEKGARWALD